MLAMDPTLAARLGRSANGTFDRAAVLCWVDDQLATPDPRTANLGERAQPGPRPIPTDRIALAEVATLTSWKPRVVTKRLCNTPALRKRLRAKRTTDAGWTFDRTALLTYLRAVALNPERSA